MGLLTRLFGTGNPLTVSGSGGQLGEHNLNKNQMLSPSDPSAITPQNANFESIRSVPVLERPRYFTKAEADKLNALALEKRAMADHAGKAYRSLKSIDTSDRVVHELHRSYQGKVARNELKKQQSNAQLGETLHKMRPDYYELGQRVESAESAANQRIQAIKNSFGA